MNLYKGLITALLSGFLLMGLAACEQKGPAEKAGEAIDNAASDVADTAKETTESVKEKLEN